MKQLVCVTPLIAVCASNVGAQVDAVGNPDDTTVTGIFARVGDTEITQAQLADEWRLAMRKRYYHGRPPEAEQQEAVRREVADDLITRIVLLQEARRRNIQPENNEIQARLDQYEKRYANSERWQQEGPAMLVAVKVRLEEDSLLRQIEGEVRRVVPPTGDQVEAYYRGHPEKFTEPKKQKVSLILLAVAPSSPESAWEAATTEAINIVAQLESGAAFDEMARLRSGDGSAEKGGDMGYLHWGMLGSKAQTVLDALAVGEISAPLRVLEGIVVLRVDDRTEPTLLELENVRERARDLWLREKSDDAWAATGRVLRESASIEILDPSLALPSTPQYEGT